MSIENKEPNIYDNTEEEPARDWAVENEESRKQIEAQITALELRRNGITEVAPNDMGPDYRDILASIDSDLERLRGELRAFSSGQS